jgi:hypothetical protein
MITDILQLAEALGLTPVGEVLRYGGGIGRADIYGSNREDIYTSIEIENRLGRAWMLLVCYDRDSFLPDLFFLSRLPDFPRDIKNSFITLSDITTIDSAVKLFQRESQFWDVKYLQSVVGL